MRALLALLAAATFAGCGASVECPPPPGPSSSADEAPPYCDLAVSAEQVTAQTFAERAEALGIDGPLDYLGSRSGVWLVGDTPIFWSAQEDSSLYICEVYPS